MSSQDSSSKRVRSDASESSSVASDSGSDVGIVSGSVTIEQLPKDIFTLILARFTLQEQMHLRRVSTQFRDTIETACQSKRILKLFDRLEDHPEWGCARYYDSFYIPHVDSVERERMALKGEDWLKVKPKKDLNSVQFANFMERLFPAVEVLVYGKEFFTSENANLIRNWPKNLRELTLVGNRLRHGFEDNLCGVINSKAGLRHLNILFHFLKTKTSILPLKPTLKRLEGYGFKTHADIKPILSNLGPNCTHLQMGRVSQELHMEDKIYFDEEKLSASIKKTSLAKTLTHLVLTEFYDEEMLEFVYKELKSLQFVGVECIDYKRDVGSPMDLSSLLNSGLNDAKNLRELKFSKINFELGYGYGSSAPKNVNSVKILRIDYSGYNCDGFSSKGWCKKLAGIFPKLEVLIAKQPYDDGDFEKDLNENAKKELKELKTVKYVDSESEEI